MTSASCNAGPLCTVSGGYDDGNGNPPGSIAANTTVALNLATVFKSKITLQSPDFTVAGADSGTLHLDRQFAPGSLVAPATLRGKRLLVKSRCPARPRRPSTSA